VLDERDDLRTPWAWLRGFAWFLLAWPVLSLLAADQFDWSEWDMILLAMLAPAGVGLALLLVERVLTKTLGQIAARRQPVPSVFRDLSNLGLTMAVLMGIDVALVSAFENESLFARADLNAGPIAGLILAICFGVAVVFRLVHRVVHGPGRLEDMGPEWGDAPTLTRFMGYLTLIPTLLVCTVMIDYTMREDPEFGPVAWVVLPLVLLLGQRSAMARSPRYWARNPWEAWVREQSLAFPWWVIVAVVSVGCAALFIVLPFAAAEDEISMVGRIIAGILLGPIGLLIIWGAALGLGRGLRLLVQQGRAVRKLRRDPDCLADWELRTTAAGPVAASQRKTADGARATTETQVEVRLRDGTRARFPVPARDGALVAWLRAHASG
jgi:hypothetical protein